MAKKLMILGTTSSAGKSLIVTALCRIYKNRGYKVAPFKAQNMALNSFITKNGREIGNAQAVQAEAAGIEPDIRMNPILLKPYTNSKSQVIVNGTLYKELSAKDYYLEKPIIFPHAIAAFKKLEKEYDIIFIEGAGSPSEINLKDVDIVNMGFAKEVNAPCIIVGDIDKGGVFAALAGTLLLFDEEERALTKGVLINKFRGDLSILKPGIVQLEQIINKPVLGVIPYLDVDIDDEDSLSNSLKKRSIKEGIDVAILKLDKLTNFTEFKIFDHFEYVNTRYIYNAREFGNPDLLIIPDSQDIVNNLKYLREMGLDGRIHRANNQNTMILGIGLGYAMLCKKIIIGNKELNGLNLFDKTATITNEKIQQIHGKLTIKNKHLDQKEITGYMRGNLSINKENIFINNQAVGNIKNNLLGIKISGFLNTMIVTEIIQSLKKSKGIKKDINIIDEYSYRQNEYNKLANSVEKSVDLNLIDKIIGLNNS